MELTLAITGASGTVYAHRTLQLLAASGQVETVHLIMSTTAATVAQVEMGEPITSTQREMIHTQFHALMEQVAAAQRGEGPMPQP